MPAPLTSTHHATVAVIGGGPAGLMAAEVLATAGATVTVFDRMASPGRKLLLAGRGGLNLTHSEPLAGFLDHYGAARVALEPAIESFGPDALRRWAADLGEETFVGSTGRVFPRAFRATPLLRAWLLRLADLGVELRSRHTWTGWSDDGALTFTVHAGHAQQTDQTDQTDHVDGVVHVHADVTVLALGGASWPRTGSNASWVEPVERIGVRVAPLRPANVGFEVAWSPSFASRFAGVPLKNVRLIAGTHESRGEAMITASGIEGGAVYELSRHLRDEVERDGATVLHVDLHPDLAVEQVTERLHARRAKDSMSSALRRTIGLPPVEIGLLREATGNRLPTGANELASLIKAVPVTLTGAQSIDRAISTAGGIALDEVDASFMLRCRPGTFVAGEMLDWEAPTGGYLLQATFSTAVAAANGAIDWLASRPTGAPS